MDLQLRGKKAFISGSCQGIGYAIAKALAKEGVDVTINGRDAVKLSAAVESLREEMPGTSVSGLVADFADPDQVDQLCAELVDVDILINNVGLFELKSFDLISDEDWRLYFEVNVLSGVRLTRHVMPTLFERGWGRVVFVSSESGVNIPAEMIHYGTSKAAMLAVGNGLAKLTRGTGVTVNSVLGGPRTPMVLLKLLRSSLISQPHQYRTRKKLSSLRIKPRCLTDSSSQAKSRTWWRSWQAQ